MAQMIIPLQTVTPLFLAGADPRGAPELRPPAFRGAMRYWLRAALGGVIGDQNLDELRKRESAVFGTAADEGGSASAVNVRLTYGELPKPQKYEKSKAIKAIEKFGKPVKQPMGEDYLYWSMAETGKGSNHQDAKSFYPPPAQFEIVLGTRPSLRDSQPPLENAMASLWLLTHLGGIGSRSRRTAGSFIALQAPTWNGPAFELKASNAKEASLFIGQGLTNWTVSIL